MGGQNSQDSTLERRSLIWNDNDIEDGTVPGGISQAEIYKGKFFTRGCRGKIEELQLYCIGDGADTITLRYSPHPCIGPLDEITIVPAAAWAWQAFVIEEMWNYDSLFIWVHACEGNVSWAFDAVEPFDGHESGDAGATWADLDIRPFIRAVYTGETPGDVPISGIINNVPIPGLSSHHVINNKILPLNTLTLVSEVEGAGYVDLVVCRVATQLDADHTYFIFYADDVVCFYWNPYDLNDWGFDAYTQPLSVTKFLEDGECVLMITKRWEFRRSFQVFALNILRAQFVYARIYPVLMR